MRRNDKEISDGSGIESIIRSSKVCRVGMVDNGAPYIVPLCFGYRDNVLYFHSAGEGRKIDVLRVNPKVCFEFDVAGSLKPGEFACGWGIDYRSVLGTGKVVFIEDADEKIEALKVLLSQYTDKQYEFTDPMLDVTTVFKIEIESMKGKSSTE